MIGYMAAAWQGRADAPRFIVVDTRGPARSPLAPLRFAAALARLMVLRCGGRPLLHVHVAGRGSTLRKALVVLIAKRLLRLPVVLHLHDYDYRLFLSRLPAPVRAPIGRMFRAADAVVVLGLADRRTVTEVLGVAPGRVFVVPNCVPPPAPSARTLPAAPSGPRPVQILFLGDPSRRKGVHDLLAALAGPLLSPPATGAGAGAPAWRAVIAGGGGELEGFRAEARALELDDRVTFPGWLPREDVALLLAKADLLVLPSYGEGMAMSVLEAMSFGLCIVSTPVGALVEVLEDAVSGLLVTPGDVEGLARALLRCIEDPALRARLGAGALARYQSGYAAQTYPDRILPVYAFAEGLWGGPGA
jgi:glycosyltransferase involved in cell wall biosynthesis